MWHLTKKYNSLETLDKLLEAEESLFISMHSSDYIRDSIDSVAYFRELRKSMAENHH